MWDKRKMINEAIFYWKIIYSLWYSSAKYTYWHCNLYSGILYETEGDIPFRRTYILWYLHADKIFEKYKRGSIIIYIIERERAISECNI